MGMFSWLCKGCGDEICCPELVRMDGQLGAYDAYGRAGEYEYPGWVRDGRNEPVAWHAVCFDNASAAEQQDQTTSKPAPNQGFGEAQDKFMPPPDTPHPHAWLGWELKDKFKVKMTFN